MTRNRALGVPLACRIVGFVCLLLVAMTAWSQQPPAEPADTQRFEIPAGPLDRALNAFARQAGWTLAVEGELTAGRQSDGLTGRFPPGHVLRRLLQGTGLAARMDSAKSVTVVQAPGGQDRETIMLDPVRVDGTLVGTRIGETVAESSASVRVFSGDNFEVRDLYNRVANLVDFGEGAFAPAIRGVDATGAASGGLAFIAGTRPRATLTVDGRPLSAFELVGSPTGLWDADRVEIYRGPQTTLQGRNSIAGAFVVETNNPSFVPESRFQASAGSRDRYRLSGLSTGPISDSVAFRVALDYLNSESFVDFKGPQGVDDVEEDERLMVRTKLLFAPASLPEFTGQLTFAHNDTRRPQSQLSDPPFGNRERTISQTAFETRSNDGILDLEYLLNERLALSNTTTFSDIRFKRLDAPANGQFKLDGPQVTNETLLNLDDAYRGLKAVLGLYVFHEDREDQGFIGTPFAFSFDDKTLTTSVFGEFERELADDWRVTVGARYEREDRERSGAAFGIVTNLDETFDAFLPKAGLAWDATDHWTFGAKVLRGFNAGGGAVSFGASDSQGNPSPDPELGPRAFVFDSEFVWNYELFSRARLFEDRLFFTANLFFSDFEDQQRVEQLDFPGGFTDAITVNTPETRAYGAELGLQYAPVEEFDVFLDVGLLNTKIDEALDQTIQGNEFARAPYFTTGFGANWRPTSAWKLGFDAQFIDEYFSTDQNNPLAEVDAYFIANASVSWKPLDHLRIFADVDNLFDSDAERRLFAFPATAPPSLANVVEPRVVWAGLELLFR